MSNYNSLSEEGQIKLVQKFGNLIRFITDPSETVQLASVKHNAQSISFIRNPSEEIQLASIKRDVRAIGLIKNPSEEIQLAAIKINSWAIQFINYPCEAVIKYCLYECDLSNKKSLYYLYDNLKSDEDKVYFKMKYGGIINV